MLGLTSRDVIHSLWVPALAGKVDMLPGRTTQLVVQAERPGVHAGRCAEFCGDQHARMTLPVVAMEPAAVTAWLQSQAGAAPAPGTAVLQRGRDAFGQLRCGACHTVRGESPSAALGPDLTRVGSRLRIGAGVLPAGPRSLQDWVADPQAFKPGANMPSYGHVDAATLADLAAYLDQLR
jgi:cytochrome c oxidase subunit 2